MHKVRRAAAAIITAVTLASAFGVAAADEVAVDTDVLSFGDQNTVTLYTTPGGSKTFTVPVSIECKTQKHMGPSTTVSMASPGPSGSTVPVGGSMSATSVTFTRPVGWPDDGSNCPTGDLETTAQPSTVTVGAPGAKTTYQYKIKWETTDDDVGEGNTGVVITLVVEDDSDGDGTTDSQDECDNDPAKTVGPCTSAPVDTDGDGDPDNADNCPSHANSDQLDTDSDGVGNVCDDDDDNDGADDGDDNCQLVSNSGQENFDGDAEGDACDADDDNDGVNDTTDACPTNPAKSTAPCVDTTPPVVSYTLDPSSPNGANGWYVSNVAVDWTVVDEESTITDTSPGCADVTISTDTTGTTLTCTATSAGGTSLPVSVTIKRDAARPTSSASGAAGGAPYTFGTWTNQAVDVTLAGQDTGGSGLDKIRYTTDGSAPSATLGTVYSAPITVSTEGTTTIRFVAVDLAGNVQSAVSSVTVKIDTIAPTVSCSAADAVWHSGDQTSTCSASDLGSGLPGASSFGLSTNVPAGTETANASTGSTSVCDNAGNCATAGPISGWKIDKKAPTGITFGGTITDGAQYYFGFVPANDSTCTATDGGSGLQSCAVTGYSTTVGAKTLTATATDFVGNADTATLGYQVLAWRLSGFHQPVDMGGTVNSVKGGSTVPLKFEVFAGTTELTDTAVVDTFKFAPVPCATLGGNAVDDVEQYTSGQTVLRYDTTGGQFIQNWQVPKTTNTCYKVVMTTDDGSAITAFFKTK